MSQSPEELRAEIDATRANLSNDVDALTDHVSPSNIAGRQKEKVKDKVSEKVSGVRDRVMGTVDDARDRVGDHGGSGDGPGVGERARGAAGGREGVGLRRAGPGGLGHPRQPPGRGADRPGARGG